MRTKTLWFPISKIFDNKIQALLQLKLNLPSDMPNKMYDSKEETWQFFSHSHTHKGTHLEYKFIAMDIEFKK
jgi:hypothetical protein